MTLIISKQNIFFTSDQHFGHKSVISLSNRPFKDVIEMNQTLVNNWNSVTNEESLIFHLGDFSHRASTNLVLRIVKSLNGKIIFINGNHDHRISDVFWKSVFYKVFDYLELTIEDDENQHIILCHYPFTTWNRSHRNSWNLHGHSHGKNLDLKHQLDVGVDCNDYKLLSYEEVKNKIK